MPAALTQSALFKESAHPVALLMLYLFRSAAIAVYVLCGLCKSCTDALTQSPTTMS